jgi:cysteine-rich repeat protein
LGLAAAALLALLLSPHKDASGQAQVRAQQNCILELNKHLVRVVKAQSGDNSRCVNYGTLAGIEGWIERLGPGGTIESCLSADTRFRVSKAVRRTTEKAAKRCVAPLPDFGATDAATVNQAAVQQPISLMHDIFNADLDATIFLRDPNDAESEVTIAAKCQAEMAGWAAKCLATKLKEFNKCKKNGLRGRRIEQLYPDAEVPFDEPLDMELCMGFDRLFRIAEDCGVRLTDKISERCPDVSQPGAFPGACFDAPELADCIDRLVECRVCLLLDEADGLNQDCDLLDDGALNNTCPPVLPFCGDLIVQDLLGEECEDGNDQSEDGCSADCLNEFCGDGVTQAGLGEVCDDGNAQDGDCCSSACDQIAPSGTICRSAADQCDMAETCTGSSGACPEDAFQPDGTSCDDADVCTSDDQCQSGSCIGDFSACGNGTIDGSCFEQCDDSNRNHCDGCSAVCLNEDGLSPDGAGASCAAILAFGFSTGDGLYWIDPDCGSKANALQCVCDMTQGGVCVSCVGAPCPPP